jgi:hypothetical protein
MSHFNESLYLRKEIQRLHEENMKLKKYLYEMQIQQDAGSLMVPEVSATPDTYVPELKQDNSRIMMPSDPNAPPKDDLIHLRGLSFAVLMQKIREMQDRGENLRVYQWLLWLKNNRPEIFDLFPKDLKDLVPDVTIP